MVADDTLLFVGFCWFFAFGRCCLFCSYVCTNFTYCFSSSIGWRLQDSLLFDGNWSCFQCFSWPAKWQWYLANFATKQQSIDMQMNRKITEQKQTEYLQLQSDCNTLHFTMSERWSFEPTSMKMASVSCGLSNEKQWQVSSKYAFRRRQVRKCRPKCLFDHTWSRCNFDLWALDFEI